MSCAPKRTLLCETKNSILMEFLEMLLLPKVKFSNNNNVGVGGGGGGRWSDNRLKSVAILPRSSF